MITNQKLLANLQQVFGPLLNEIVERAEKSLNLDERIEACRIWPGGDEDYFVLPGLEKLKHERDSEDYSAPASFYACICKWQAMTEAEALASFRTDADPRNPLYTEQQLKEFYAFLCKWPMPPLTVQEKTALYDHGENPEALKAMFEAMSDAGLTHLFEDTFDYNNMETWYLCMEDYSLIEKAFQKTRGDALFSFFRAATEVLAEQEGNAHALADKSPQKTILELLIDFQGMTLDTFQAKIQAVFGDSAQPDVIAGLHSHIKTIQPQEPTEEEIRMMKGGVYPEFLRPFYLGLPPAEEWLLSQYFQALCAYDYFRDDKERDFALEWVVDKGRWDQDFRAWLLNELHKPLSIREMEPFPWEDYGLEPNTQQVETDNAQQLDQPEEGRKQA